MKKYLTLFLIISTLASVQAIAQTSIYTQNFDSSPTLPTGWYASPNSWYVDTTTSNSSTGYTGASGLHNVVIKDTTARTGNDTLLTAAISTIGYKNILVDWGTRFSKHFADAGSTVSLLWSIDGSTWTPVTYIEDSNNSVWALDNRAVPIALPMGASDQASLQLMWVANIHFTTSGTYRIDDLTVTGTAIPAGIAEVSNENAFASVFVNSNKMVNVSLVYPPSHETTVEIFDMTGRMIKKVNMEAQSMLLDGKEFAQGVYVVRVSQSGESIIKKISLK